jgi:hypothetical protein
MEAAVLVLTVAFVWQGFRTDLPAGASTWRATASGQLTGAGWWYTLFSLPLFQFLIWRWCARLLIWGRLLWRLARLELQLVPTHPDRAGGLGGLGVVHVALSPFVFALSAMLVASFSEQILYGGEVVTSLVPRLAGVVVLLTLIVVAPLMLFAPRLVAAKQQGAIEYGDLASGYVRAFDQKWIGGATPHGESLLGSADLQSLADLANAFGVIRGMRIVPIELTQLLLIAGAVALPMAPLVLFVVPLEELLFRAVKTILHV